MYRYFEKILDNFITPVKQIIFYIPPEDSGGFYGFTLDLCVCLSSQPPVVCPHVCAVVLI